MLYQKFKSRINKGDQVAADKLKRVYGIKAVKSRFVNLENNELPEYHMSSALVSQMESIELPCEIDRFVCDQSSDHIEPEAGRL